MRKTRDDSRIEIWCTNYINKRDARHIIDKDATIIQIEHAHEDDYIVEVIDAEGDED